MRNAFETKPRDTRKGRVDGTDPLSAAERSERMRRVRSSDTKLETEFRKALWAAGVRGWRCNVKDVAGKPDLCWRSRRIAVFLDSAWWHGHKEMKRTPPRANYSSFFRVTASAVLSHDLRMR